MRVSQFLLLDVPHTVSALVRRPTSAGTASSRASGGGAGVDRVYQAQDGRPGGTQRGRVRAPADRLTGSTPFAPTSSTSPMTERPPAPLPARKPPHPQPPRTALPPRPRRQTRSARVTCRKPNPVRDGSGEARPVALRATPIAARHGSAAPPRADYAATAGECRSASVTAPVASASRSLATWSELPSSGCPWAPGG